MPARLPRLDGVSRYDKCLRLAHYVQNPPDGFNGPASGELALTSRTELGVSGSIARIREWSRGYIGAIAASPAFQRDPPEPALQSSGAALKVDVLAVLFQYIGVYR